LGIGDWAQSPIPNPQSPIPNPQYLNIKKIFIIIIKSTFNYKNLNKKNIQKKRNKQLI
jgi:hypothetical protein